MSSVNGAVPTTIIIAGLALAGYALLMTALNRRMGTGLLAALGVLEILLLVLVGLIVARLVGGGRPAAGLAILIGYLIATPLIPLAAGFWGALERSRWGPAVIAVAGLVAAVLMVRLHEIWPVIRV
jgi:phosphotransferase system  glucose/maltose/N-acetylglucosamine-specific IIC component